jgi:hypothetical protein
MESLAYLVMGLLLAQIFLGAIALVFAIVWRSKGKFGRTSVVLIALLALQTVWAFNTAAAFGYIAFTFLSASALLRFLPKK